MEYLYLDGEIYMVSKADMKNVNHAIGNCCDSCCPETLQELRRVFTDIKRRYKAFEVEGPHTTPYEQFDPTSADYYKNHEFGLPFGEEETKL